MKDIKFITTATLKSIYGDMPVLKQSAEDTADAAEKDFIRQMAHLGLDRKSFKKVTTKPVVAAERVTIKPLRVHEGG